MPLGFDILHEDEACLVVAKPGGLLTQAPLGIDSLEVRIKKFLRERDNIEGDVYLGVPHRLDRPASGAIVFAKNLKTAQKLSKLFERRYVEKTYWALVEGAVTPDAGTWTDQLQKIEGQPRTIVVDASEPAGRLAILHYRVIEQIVGPICRMGPGAAESASKSRPAGETYTLLEIKLETGRTHQIRVQCASRGHPLCGDELYGSKIRFGPWSDDERERLIALHARGLRFRKPGTHDYIAAIAPLPDVWREVGSAEDFQRWQSFQ